MLCEADRADLQQGVHGLRLWSLQVRVHLSSSPFPLLISSTPSPPTTITDIDIIVYSKLVLIITSSCKSSFFTQRILACSHSCCLTGQMWTWCFPVGRTIRRKAYLQQEFVLNYSLHASKLWNKGTTAQRCSS